MSSTTDSSDAGCTSGVSTTNKLYDRVVSNYNIEATLKNAIANTFRERQDNALAQSSVVLFGILNLKTTMLK